MSPKVGRSKWTGTKAGVGLAIGRAIGMRRHVLGLSQRELGESAGASKDTIAKVEAGEQIAPLWLLFSVAEVLGCEPWELLKEACERAREAA